jgi:hypothetical protein
VCDRNLRPELAGEVGGTPGVGQKPEAISVGGQAPGDPGADAFAGGGNDCDES